MHCVYISSLVDAVQSFAYLSKRDFPEELCITLKRTFNSCQRWSITCHTYICKRACTGWIPFSLSRRDSTTVECPMTKTAERLIRLDAELSKWQPQSHRVRAGWDAPALKSVWSARGEWGRQVFIQLERDTMWWGFLLLLQQRHTQAVVILHPAPSIQV